MNTKLADPFWGLVDIREHDDCWEWQGVRYASGYGRAWVPEGTLLPGLDGGYQAAHRVAYFLANKKWPGRMFVCHSCDHPPCVNPAHLWLGTAKQNNDDRAGKGRNGPRGKTSEETAKQVCEAVAAGRKISHIAREFGISRMTVYRVLDEAKAQALVR